jgi:uncharacterized repeat protein (TIGR01451 family)
MLPSFSGQSDARRSLKTRKPLRRKRFSLDCESLEQKALLATFYVTNPGFVADPWTTTGTLHNALVQARSSPGPHTIEFSIGANDGLILVNGGGLPQVTQQIRFNGSSYQGVTYPARNIAIAFQRGFNNDDLDRSLIPPVSDGFLLYFQQSAAGSSIENISFIGYDFNTTAGINGVFSASQISLTQQNTFGTARIAVATDVQARINPIGTGVQLSNVNGAEIRTNLFQNNGGPAISLTGTSRNNYIDNNTIIRNAGGGVNMSGGGDFNTITDNVIYRNGNRGIAIGAGSNEDVVPPIITLATLRTGNFFFNRRLSIAGYAEGLDDASEYLIQYFTTEQSNANSSNDAQGQTHLNFLDDRLRPVNGRIDFSVSTTFFGTATMQVGDYITATITKLQPFNLFRGSTSTFSRGQNVEAEPIADMSVAVAAPMGVFEVGDVVDYVAYVSNFGPNGTGTANLSNTLSSNFEIAALPIVNGVTVNYTGFVDNGATFSFDVPIGTVGAFQDATVVLKLRAKVAGALIYDASASSGTFDPNPFNDDVQILRDAIPESQATLKLAGEVRSDKPLDPTIAVGETLSYELSIQNEGPDAAKTVIARTVIPIGFEFVGANATTGTTSYDATTRTLVAYAGNVDNVTKVLIRLRATRSGIFSIVTEASTSSLSNTPVVPITTTFAVNDLPGSLRFGTSKFTFEEQPVPQVVYIPVTRVQGTQGVATVKVKSKNGTAIAGIDYVEVDETIVFPSGDQSIQYVPVTLLTTTEWYQSRSFELVMTDATGAALGFPSSAVVTITDSQPAPVGTIKFKSVSPNPVSESGGFVTVEVERVDGTSKALSVTYATSNGSAIAGVNYTATSGTLIWAEGELGTKSFRIPIRSDGVYTPDMLDFGIAIAPANADTTITGPTAETIGIVNTTQLSNVGFTPANYQVLEDAGSVTLTLTRTIQTLPDGTIPAISVDFATANGTAVAGVDYTAASGTINWAAGDVSPKTITISVIDKSTIELDRNFFVNLSNASANAVITSATAQVIIKDTDIDSDGPTVGAVQFDGSAASISQIYLTFSEPLDVASATNAANYLITNAGGQATLVTGVQYLAASNAVIVNLPANTLRANTFYTLTVNGTSPNGVTDVFGNLLNGTGTNGTNYVIGFARGTSVSYTDNMNNTVQIGLRGGFFDITRLPNGQAQTLAVSNVTRSSVLSGSVRRINSSSTGYTRIDVLSGIGQPRFMKISMTTPPFYVGQVQASNPPLPGGGSTLAASRIVPVRQAPAKTIVPTRLIRKR